MSAHTSEPWTAELTDDPEDGSDAYAVDCPDHSIALMDAPGGPELNEANARRIAACVNACAGVPQSVLETIGPKGGFANGVAVLMEDRTALAAALRDLVEISEIAAGMGAMVDRPDMNGPLPRARAVLAKVKA